MYQDRYKVYASIKKKEFIENYRQTNPEHKSKLSSSPKKKHVSPQYERKSYFQEDTSQLKNFAKCQPHQFALNCEKDPKLSALIYEAISSADRVMKLVFNYDFAEIERMSSKYFFNKQKLYSYLHNQSIGLSIHKSKNSKQSRFKSKRQDSQDEKQQVSLKQLKRLETIVYNKIIPILKQETPKSRKKQKYSKVKYDLQDANPERKEGLYLLQKLNSKSKKFNLDELIEVLEKYILKVIDKETKLLSKVNVLQQKLAQQISKVEQYQNFIKKREDEKHQDDIQRANQLKRMVKYEDFVKCIQSILKQQQEDYFTKQIQNLELLASRVRKILYDGDKKEKKCIHKQKSKQYSESEHNKSDQQKVQKEIIRSLNKEVGELKDICEQLQEKLRNNNDNMIKGQYKERKLMKQNQQLCLTIQKISEDLNNANRMVQQYLTVLGKIDQELKQNQDNLNHMKQEHQREEEYKKNMQEKNQQLLKHLQEIEQRYRQLEQLGEKKDKENEELVQNLYSKQVQIKQLISTTTKYEKQIKMLNNALIERQEALIKLQQKIKIIQEQTIQLNNKTNTLESNQTQKNNEYKLHPIAVVVDDLFIDKSEPNHQRSDFIPSHRFKDIPQQIHAQSQHLIVTQINTQLLSQLMSQKQKVLLQSNKNKPITQDKKGQVRMQSLRAIEQKGQLIKIEDEKEIKSFSEQSNLDNIQKNPQPIQGGLIQAHSSFQMLQNINNEELINTNRKLRQKIIELSKSGCNNHSLVEIDLFNKQIQRIENLLQLRAKNTSQQLKKLYKLEAQNKLASEEIQYLKSKMDPTNLKNTFVSNIPSQSQTSNFSLEGPLRQMLKQKSPFIEIVQKYSDLAEQSNKKIQKHETGVQTQGLMRIQNLVESEVFRYLPEIKKMLSKEEVNQTINQSIIYQLEMLNTNMFHHSLKVQRVQPPIQDQGILNTTLPEKSEGQSIQLQNQDADNMRKARFKMLQNSLKDLGNLMNYHKNKYLTLHNLFKQTSSKNMELFDLAQTPSKKSLLQNQQYVQQLLKAPQKHQQIDIFADEKVVQKFQQKLNFPPSSKQNVYQLMVIQKQEENLRLKQIIDKLGSKQYEKEQILQSEQRIKYQLIQKNKLMQKQLEQLIAFNQELKRQMQFLKTKNKRYERESSELGEDAEEVADFNEPAGQKQTEERHKQHAEVKQQKKQQSGSKVAQYEVQKQAKQSVAVQNIKKSRSKSTPQREFTWQDLIPQYFSRGECEK